MSESLFYPRALVRLAAVINGEETDFDVEPHQVTVTRRSHKHVDECEIAFMESALPSDPRYIEDVLAVVFIGDAGSLDGGVREPSNIRFVGEIDDQDRDFADTSTVKLKFHDLSMRAREQKKLPFSVMPRYADSLGTALERLRQAVPGWADLVTLRKVPELDTPLGKLTSARGRSGFVPMPNNDPNAWEVIEVVAGLCGFLVELDLQEIVVRPPRDVFGDPGQPEGDKAEFAFEYGTEQANVLRVTQHKRFLRHRKGVKVVCRDNDARQTYEAEWPPDNKLPPRRRPRPVKAKSRHHGSTKPTAAPPPPERDPFFISGIHTRDAALDVAKRIWTERATQEIDGTLESPIFAAGALALRNGSRVTVKIKPDLEVEIRSAGSEDAAVKFLTQRRLMTEAAARVLVRASRRKLSNLFYVDSATLHYSSSSDPGISIKFINLIVV